MKGERFGCGVVVICALLSLVQGCREDADGSQEGSLARDGGDDVRAVGEDAESAGDGGGDARLSGDSGADSASDACEGDGCVEPECTPETAAEACPRPDGFCDGDVVVTFSGPGACREGACDYSGVEAREVCSDGTVCAVEGPSCEVPVGRWDETRWDQAVWGE